MDEDAKTGTVSHKGDQGEMARLLQRITRVAQRQARNMMDIAVWRVLAIRRLSTQHSEAGDILLVHPGYSQPRHQNNLEIIATFLREYYNYRIVAVICNGLVKACDYRSSIYDPVDMVKTGWERPCRMCSRLIRARLSSFCDEVIDLADFLEDSDRLEINRYIADLGEEIRWRDYLHLVFADIGVGRMAAESLEYYFHSGRFETLSLRSGTAAHEFLRTALTFVRGAKRLLDQRAFVAMLVSEPGYTSWGSFVQVGFTRSVPVVSQSNAAYMDDTSAGHARHYLTLDVYREKRDLYRYQYAPPEDEVTGVFSSPDKLKEMSVMGQRILNTRMRTANSADLSSEPTLRDWGDLSDKRTVLVLPHVCWDSALTMGEQFFDGAEDWLEFVYKAAQRNTRVRWIFKVHPGESPKYGINPQSNTHRFLETLTERCPAEHIRVLGPDTPVSIYDLFPVLLAGVTDSGGASSVELPSFGVPVIIGGKGGYAGFGFTVDCQNTGDLERRLLSVDEIDPVTDHQQTLACAFAALLFRPTHFLLVSDLYRRDDLGDSFLDPRRVREFVRDPQSAAFFLNRVRLQPA